MACRLFSFCERCGVRHMQLEYTFAITEEIEHKCVILVDVPDDYNESMCDDTAWEEMESRVKNGSWRQSIQETDNEYSEPSVSEIVDCIEVVGDDDDDA